MSDFMAFPVVSFIFITLLVIVSFCKPRLNSKEKYLNAGFDDYLAKPIKIKELERVLRKYSI